MNTYTIPANRPGENHMNLTSADNITCYSQGNPTPTYTWQKIQGQDDVEFHTEAMLKLTGDMVGSELNIYNCTATNEIEGQTYSDEIQVKFYVRMGYCEYYFEEKASSVYNWKTQKIHPLNMLTPYKFCLECKIVLP